MTGPSTTAVDPDGTREPDLILARVHLLLGSLSLARAELETLAGRGTLDDDAIRDLAEARWRTGDMTGAGEAATAWLESHPDDILGLVIAAEAQAALGRPSEARRLAGRAMEHADGSLDPVFAGMQRSPIWPDDPGSPSTPVGVLFDDLHPGPLAVRPLAGAVRTEGRPVARTGAAGPLRAAPAHREEATRAGSAHGEGHGPIDPDVPAALAGGQSLWGDDAADAVADADEALDPTVLFHRARVALDEGRAAEAATGLILALRASPGLAPAVLDLLSGRSESILALVRGDAQWVVGREVEAMRDHAVAAGALAPVRSPSDARTGGPHTHPKPEAEPVPRPEPEPEPSLDLEDS